MTLRGVARKTANVVLGNAFGIPGIAVDTHMIRVNQRLALTEHEDPVKIEADLAALVPRDHWTRYTNQVIHHGRVCCIARRPLCEECPVERRVPEARRRRRARASAGARRRAGEGRARGAEHVSSRIAYRGRSIVVAVDEVELPNGRRVALDVVRHPGASAVVPFETASTVLLIRQFRHAAGGTIWEVPAGKLDGDAPERLRAQGARGGGRPARGPPRSARARSGPRPASPTR